MESLRDRLRPVRRRKQLRTAWDLWDWWASEIIADFWSISRISIGSTLVLIGLVSLPGAFVFQPSDDDLHPMPWIRVLLSCTIGERLYQDPRGSGSPRPGARCNRSSGRVPRGGLKGGAPPSYKPASSSRITECALSISALASLRV